MVSFHAPVNEDEGRRALKGEIIILFVVNKGDITFLNIMNFIQPINQAIGIAYNFRARPGSNLLNCNGFSKFHGANIGTKEHRKIDPGLDNFLNLSNLLSFK